MEKPYLTIYKGFRYSMEGCLWFEETACCALKHNTPCGVAVGENSKEVYLKAYDADPVSILVE